MKREEAIEIAKKLYNESLFLKKDKEAMVTLIPELAESEDERIRKAIIRGMYALKDQKKTCFASIPIDDVIAYLEKQGKQNEIIDRNEFVQSVLVVTAITLITWIDCNTAEGNTYLSNMECKDIKNSLVNCNWNKIYAYMKNKLEKQGEQNKVEPKFKVGDWVVYHRNDSSTEIMNVYNIRDNRYYFNDNIHFSWSVKECDEKCHIWTIQDAKDGDVLVSESQCGLGTWYCIFKSLDDDESMAVYCYLARDGRVETKRELCFDKDPFNTKPATKEQRDLLFQKMYDAGYKWDAEKKELKKMEQKSYNKTSYPQTLDKAIDLYYYSYNYGNGNYGFDNLSLAKFRDIVHTFIEDYGQKSAKWSEGDKKMISDIATYLNRYGNYILNKNEEKAAEIHKAADWIKSLKDKVYI